jgi:hypothetical protein
VGGTYTRWWLSHWLYNNFVVYIGNCSVTVSCRLFFSLVHYIQLFSTTRIQSFFFFLWLYSPILGLGRLHETFRFISVTRNHLEAGSKHISYSLLVIVRKPETEQRLRLKQSMILQWRFQSQEAQNRICFNSKTLSENYVSSLQIYPRECKLHYGTMWN